MKQQGDKFEVAGMTFLKTKFDSMDGKTVICFAEDSGTPTPFQVRITKNGMQFKGDMSGAIFSENDVQNFAQFMSIWVGELRKIRTKIETSLSGH